MTFRYPLSVLFLLGLLCFQATSAQAQDNRDCFTLPKSSATSIIDQIIDVKATSSSPWPINDWKGRWHPGDATDPQTIYCYERRTLKLVVTDTGQLESTGGPLGNRFKTGIPGTELGIGFGYGRGNSVVRSITHGWEMTVEANTYTPYPDKILAMVYRTESRVPRTGRMGPISYTAKLMDGPRVIHTYRIQSSIEFTNNIYLMSCTADQKVVQVPMGAATVSSMRANASPVRSYDLDVTCEDGPTGVPPVKIYFVGETTPQGVLRLSEVPHTATGVGIAVSDTNGNPLPFDRKKALRMTHVGRIKDIDRYHFQGRAQYVTIPERQLGPGRADAAMTYVLDYN